MKVYVSCTPDTASLAERLATDLEGHDLTPLYDRGHPERGSFWSEERVRVRRSAHAWAFLIGQERDSRVEREWSSAAEESWADPRKRMIPLLVGGAEPPPFLRDRRAIRIAAARSDDDDWERLVRSLVSAVGGARKYGTRADAPAVLREERRRRIRALQTQASGLEPEPDDLRRRAESLERQLASQRGTGDPAAALTAAQLGDVRKSLGDKEKALASLEVALAVQQEHAPAIDPAVARTHANIATLLADLGRYEKARDHLADALAIYEKTSGRKSIVVGITELRLASVLQKLGNTEAAAVHRKAGLGAAKATGLKILRSIPFIGQLIAPAARGSGRRRSSREKPARAKSAARKAAPQKKAAKKATRKKTAPGRKAAKKTARKKAAPRKKAAKKTARKKTAPGRKAAKKATRKKTAPGRKAAKKTARKKAAPRKKAAKKAVRK